MISMGTLNLMGEPVRRVSAGTGDAADRLLRAHIWRDRAQRLFGRPAVW